MCKTLKVSRSSYRRSHSDDPCNRILEDQKLTLKIRNIFYMIAKLQKVNDRLKQKAL